MSQPCRVGVCSSEKLQDPFFRAAVVTYLVEVYTGSLLGSDTEANVFVTLHGESGDTGRRILHKSLNHQDKFLESQVNGL